MDKLGRYYTCESVSSFLVENLETKEPKRILDLGIGNASLSIAAYSRWESAKYFATDIEKQKTLKIEKTLSYINVLTMDTLNPNASARLEPKFGLIDIAICNPPYGRIKDKNKYNKLFKEIECDSFIKLKKITSEIVFFAHNLKLLKKNGELGIIVSDSLITGKDFAQFRKTILETFNVRKIVQLPEKTFKKTDAKTYIIILSKSAPTSNICQLMLFSKSNSMPNAININKKELINRMDYSFYCSEKQSNNLITLRDLGAIISRGKFTHKQLKQMNCDYFHSTSFKAFDKQIKIKYKVHKKMQKHTACSGDILLCRVGKGISEKIAIIVSGQVIFSDCIYRISLPKEFQRVVFNSLLCDEGKQWLNRFAHGVCAPVISKSDLENFPIYCMYRVQS